MSITSDPYILFQLAEVHQSRDSEVARGNADFDILHSPYTIPDQSPKWLVTHNASRIVVARASSHQSIRQPGGKIGRFISIARVVTTLTDLHLRIEKEKEEEGQGTADSWRR